MNYRLLAQLHIIFAALFLGIFIILPVSGGLYLLGSKGSFPEKFLFEKPLLTEKLTKDKVDSLLKSENYQFSYEYLKFKGNNIILRPSHKKHIVIKKEKNSLKFFKVQPDFIGSIVEIHKGHGPTLLKRLQTLSALGFIILLISGFLMFLKKSTYRKEALISFSVGTVLFLLTLFI